MKCSFGDSPGIIRGALLKYSEEPREERMLNELERLYDLEVTIDNETIGNVSSVLFDDRSWDIDYLIIDVGDWLRERHILLSTQCLKIPDWDNEQIEANVTKKKVEQSPTINLSEPVSEKRLLQLHQYYGWTPFRPGLMPLAPTPIIPVSMIESGATRYKLVKKSKGKEEHPEKTIHLRSSKEILDYSVVSNTEEFGNVEDILFNAMDWKIRYLIIDVSDWFDKEHRLIPVDWIESMKWIEQKITVDVSKEKVENAPEFIYKSEITREDESILYEYYSRSGYWM